MSTTTLPAVAVVLAAGKGTRMRSDLPKVLHEVGGRPMLSWVLDAAREAGCERLLVIIGHGADQIRERYADESDITWVLQEEQLGTGHALAQAEAAMDGEAAALLVLSGDVPLVRAETLKRLAAAASAERGSMVVAEHEHPGSLGRVLAAADGRLERIVEASDASPEELLVRRINAGIYALPAPQIFDDLRRLDRNNAKGEYYLTDALGIAGADGRALELVDLDDPSEAFGVNSRRDLAKAHGALGRSRVEALLDEGVTILAPERTWIDPRVRVGTDTVIHPEVSLHGHTRIGAGCVLGQGCIVRDSEIDDDVELHPYSLVDQSRVASGCAIGPFARLRPASVLLTGSRVGNFVELKKTELGEGAKASHLTYLGDAVVGAGSNVGAGVVTCNYDGEKKHRTEIGEGAFVGSDTMLVAPVRVGDGATTGAGSVITHEVPDGALAVGRARQRNVPDWAQRRRKKKEA